VRALLIAALLHVAVVAIGPIFSANVPVAETGPAPVLDTIEVVPLPDPLPPLPTPAAVAKDDEAKSDEASDEDEANAKPTSPPEGAAREASPAAAKEASNEPAPTPNAAPESPPGAAHAPEAPASPTGEGPTAPNVAPGVPPGVAAAPSGPPKDEYGPPSGNGSGGPNVVVPGLGGPVWALPGVIAPLPAPTAAPTVATGPKPVDKNVAGQVLSGGLQKKDQDVGIALPAAGVVATSVASVVRSSDTPGDAKATIEVKLGTDGKVTSVRVVKSNGGDAGAWDRVAKNAAAQLAGKSLTMTGDAAAHGATVTVNVESKEVFAAGTNQKLDAQPVCAEEVLAQMANALADPANALGGAGDPAARQINANALANQDPAKRKFCIPVGIMGKGDVSNVGSHAQRVVSTKFTVNVPGSRVLADVKKVDTRAPWSAEDPNLVRAKRPWEKKKKPKKK
jgi:hypothetical protein